MAEAEMTQKAEVEATIDSNGVDLSAQPNRTLLVDTNEPEGLPAPSGSSTPALSQKQKPFVPSDSNVVEAAKPNSTTKLETRSKEELIQLIKKQLGLLKQARQTSAQYKEEANELKQQVANFESKLQKNSASLNDAAIKDLELLDYKKSMETLRKKLETADRTIAEKDEMQKELGQKLHALTEKNIELEETVDRQAREQEELNKKTNDLEHSIAKSEHDFGRERTEAEERVASLLKEVEDMREVIKKQKKELNSIRTEDSDQKNELNRFIKSNEQLQRKYDELQAEFSAYKEKAEFVLRQNEEERKEKSRDQTFELQELNRQLKLKSDHIFQLTDKLTSAQQETNSLVERCRLLRSELDDARHSTAALQRENRDERKQLQAEHEQKLRQVNKELEKNKREILHLREQNAADRKAQDETIVRKQAEYNLQLQELRDQLARLQSTERNESIGQEQAKVPPSPNKKTSMAAVRPLNFDVESHFSAHEMHEMPTSKPDGNEMIASLSELINGEDFEKEGRRLGTSMSSLNSWVEPEQLEAQLKHTRALLHEVEEHNSKLEAQNRVLKEEIRKAERDNKSAEHIGENMQYFKSVMLAFLKPEKINDTRLQLLPVLSTMLSFSTEEKKAVEQALQQQQKERDAAANQSAEWAGAGYLGALSGIF